MEAGSKIRGGDEAVQGVAKGIKDWIVSSKVPHKVRKSTGIKTGLIALDKKIGGLNKGEMTIVSGSNASGKSSWLSQVALEAIEQGVRVAMFSGELTAQRVFEWMFLPAAGMGNLIPTEYDSLYNIKDDVLKKIEAWYDKRVYLYNNDNGIKLGSLIEKIDYLINLRDRGVKHLENLDLVIVDNMMSLDIGSSDSKYERQTQVITQLSQKAKQWNAHVVFVCHPRKTTGFLRKDDIAGTADITNAADNVFIVHRVNNDFNRLASEFFGGPKVLYSQVGEATNMIEVCKNRDLGVMDFMARMYFEVGSRRFKNSPDEDKNYGWEYDKMDNQAMEVEQESLPIWERSSKDED